MNNGKCYQLFPYTGPTLLSVRLSEPLELNACQVKPCHFLQLSISLSDYLSEGFYCYDERPCPWSKLGRKGFIWLIPLDHSLSMEEVRAETQAGLEPGGRSWCSGHGEELLTDLLPMACSACFLIEPRTTSPGMAPPTRGWTCLHQSITKKMPYSWILWRHFLNWGSLSDNSSLGVKLT